jgi:pimeloyl-ACP methyl ester carboxylesterase
MASFVLIHGAWHGAWCWERVVPLLARAGHRVAAPDLPGHGMDQTPAREVTLEACAARVCAVAAGQTRPVILVGHSLGGIVVSQAAERCPERVDLLVYLAAFLLPHGHSRGSWGQSAPEMAASLSPVTRATTIDREAGVIAVASEAARELFYGDCSEEEARRATARLRPEPLASALTPLSVSAARWGSVPRAYIETLRDRAIPLEAQRAMRRALPCASVVSMDTSHSPFLSEPEALAAHLIELSRSRA